MAAPYAYHSAKAVISVECNEASGGMPLFELTHQSSTCVALKHTWPDNINSVLDQLFDELLNEHLAERWISFIINLVCAETSKSAAAAAVGLPRESPSSLILHPTPCDITEVYRR